MSEKHTPGVPFDSDDADEQRLWQTLGELPRNAPSPRLRQAFYRELDRASAPRWPERVRTWLGLSGSAGWLTATACLVLGLAMGQTIGSSDDADSARLTALQRQVAMLNRSLILDRLENASPGKRLRGIIDAVGIVEHDTEIASALLARATEDRVHSIRSAAIDALGPQVTTPAVGDELMNLLEATQSPLVQLALIDLVLRHGSAAQLERLLALADQGRLHSDLVPHVKASIRRNRV